ncbi:hypothetical protein P4O66_000523 [Electrophorus voltai]|uniref:G8 domain-containing protein n=1 Tax=Electrophorus voltai TaxID=2609070 RepID=A0AAD8ZFC7_9TELE|nr:hypothetical protein P4O66_000523 [Electrophorus voltai]
MHVVSSSGRVSKHSRHACGRNTKGCETALRSGVSQYGECAEPFPCETVPYGYMFAGPQLKAALLFVCPDKIPGLQPWTPGFSEAHHVTIGYGRKVLLISSATVHSIEIVNGGKLVIADTNRPILLRTKHILIGNNGELHIGSPDCPYKGNLTISLYGRSDDSDVEHSYFGRKYIGVGTGGTLEIHGEKTLSWTFLNKTLHPGEGNENSYHFERSWGNRGIIVHVVDSKTGEVLQSDRFDTYRSKDESRRLAQYVEDVKDGQILAMVVNDEGSNNLEDSAKKALSKLGSRHFHRLGFRSASAPPRRHSSWFISRRKTRALAAIFSPRSVRSAALTEQTSLSRFLSNVRNAKTNGTSSESGESNLAGRAATFLRQPRLCSSVQNAARMRIRAASCFRKHRLVRTENEGLVGG